MKTVIDDMSECRLVLVLVAGVLMTAACGGAGSKAPVVERSTATAAGQRSSASGGIPPPRAGLEVGDTDWTATVRPLGESHPTASRALPGESSPAPPAPPASSTAQAPASGGATTTAANPAVISLLNTASAQSQAGNYSRAAATLERAIAIEPNNAWLWHRLADTRLKEGRLQQAAGLAAKSTSLASADSRLQADNWRLIAEVHRRQGDTAGAAAAESQAGKLGN